MHQGEKKFRLGVDNVKRRVQRDEAKQESMATFGGMKHGYE